MQDHGQNRIGRSRKRPISKIRSGKKLFLLLLAVIAITTVTAGGTLAYIATKSETVTNTFEPAQMSCVVEEAGFDGETKTGVTVKNTSDTSAYIRVKLLPYWYDKDKDRIIAKSAWNVQEKFILSDEWFLGSDGYYYHKEPVASQANTSELIESIKLEQDNVTLARQVLEIIASCIQSEPEAAVEVAWSAVDVDASGNLKSASTGAD